MADSSVLFQSLFLRAKGIGRKTLSQVGVCLDKWRLTWEQVWQEDKVQKLVGLSQKQRLAITQVKKSFPDNEKWCDHLKKLEIVLVGRDEPHFPELLKEIDDAPLVLFAQGNIELLRADGIKVAVVGTRKITSYGVMATRKICSELGQLGVVIVSGGMYGVDECAHRAALDAHTPTIAVSAAGLDMITSPWQQRLCRDILAGGGLLLSEYPPGIYARKAHFPLRNRIVAGLSHAVVVTEAAIGSGSLITANLAAEYGREVAAVPGPITSKFSQGTKDLLNQGAKLVTSGLEVVSSLPDFSTQSLSTHDVAQTTITGTILTILNRLGPVSTDRLITETYLPAASVHQALAELELAGRITAQGNVWLAFGAVM